MNAPDKIYVNIPGDYWHPGTDKKLNTDTEYIRKDTLLELISKQLQEQWRASSSQADNDEYYKNPLVKQLKGLINEIESL